jgi:hypothetical protein
LAMLGTGELHLDSDGVLALLYRLNEGNPHYTPYKVKE